MKKPRIQETFSNAAAALTELYRASTDAYEEGYRDALLLIHRYLLLTTTRGVPAGTAPAPSGAPSPSPPCPPLEVETMLRFVHKTLELRRERVALRRGVPPAQEPSHSSLVHDERPDDGVDTPGEEGGPRDGETSASAARSRRGAGRRRLRGVCSANTPRPGEATSPGAAAPDPPLSRPRRYSPVGRTGGESGPVRRPL